MDGVSVRDVRALVADDPTADARNNVDDDAAVCIRMKQADGSTRIVQCTEIYVREIEGVGVALVVEAPNAA